MTFASLCCLLCPWCELHVLSVTQGAQLEGEPEWTPAHLSHQTNSQQDEEESSVVREEERHHCCIACAGLFWCIGNKWGPSKVDHVTRTGGNR